MEQKKETCYTESKIGMNTFLRMTSYDESGKTSFKTAWEVLHRIERLCSRFESTSEVSKINLLAGQERVKVSKELSQILKTAQSISSFTDGAFDATIGAVTDLWSIGANHERIPLEEENKQAKSLVNYRLIDIQEDSVFLPHKGMKLDLGGIAKEFAVHLAAQEAEMRGLRAGIIDAGGDICIVGNKPDQQPWRMGIQHPRQKNTLLASVAMQMWDTIETSGDYCRFLQREDFFCSHIFSSHFDKEMDDLMSVTLIYRRSKELLPVNGTAFLVSGLKKSQQLLARLPELEGVFVTRSMDVFITEGLRNYITILPQDMQRQTFVLKRKGF
ncbi:FAD:protein FMN transferase [Anaerosinus massiliensis]|uniref:FAD:protein FMN transferase n=1 Tax=Massilibacillus massiliensis TaxID=1806837 RepID=UPI000DA61912|nr:FAD:protein FMN transferase [Massilibacillus massiliensis]